MARNDWLETKMAERGLTPRLLREKVGAPQQVVSTWLNNTRGVGATYQDRLASVLGVEPAELLTNVGPQAEGAGRLAVLARGLTAPVRSDLLAEVREVLGRVEAALLVAQEAEGEDVEPPKPARRRGQRGA